MPAKSMQSKTSKPDFQAVQRQFTGNMRDPAGSSAPADIEERRLQIYRDLIYNNIQGFLANSFPVIRKIMTDDEWHDCMKQYVARHEAQTPLFPKMPQEFLKYIETNPDAIPDQYPFIAELAHYEWLETSVSLDTREIDSTSVDAEGDLLDGIPVINPVAVPWAYRWPVHKISPDFLPDDIPDNPTYLIVFRKPGYEIGFMELNPLSARLVEIVIDNRSLTGRAMLQQIATEIQHPDVSVIIDGGAEILNSMREKSVILGTKLEGIQT